MKKLHAAIALALTGSGYVPAFAAASETQAGHGPERPRDEVGRMLETADGRPIAPIYDIGHDGNPRIIFGHRLVSVPTATLSKSGKRLVTALSLSDLERIAQP